jgi:anthraniloyl-CoA monooxygenase
VLLGDAAHTAHFSIGSGTKLAMEDALALAACLHEQPDCPAALAAYEAERRPVVLSTQRAAQASLEWFENLGQYVDQDPIQFAFNIMTRSRRVTYDNLRVRDPEFVEAVDSWFGANEAARGFGSGEVRPPMFQPFRLRQLELANRVVVSPMDMYRAEDGLPTDFHLVHLGGKALEFVHAESNAKIGVQLGHAGRKGSTRLMWEGIDDPLPDGNWPIVAPSPVPYRDGINQVPRELTHDELHAITAEFVDAARRADAAGFDLLELHCAHGYLLSSFISPLTNRRTDEYGGSLANRMRFPTDVFSAIRAVWPDRKPMSVRISATDWCDDGITANDAVEMAKAFAAVGVDIVDVSTGQVVADERPAFGRSYQTPFADRIRNEAGIPTMAVGIISSYDDVNSILLAGRADLCLLGRAHLYNPNWTLHAAAEQEYTGPAAAWPLPWKAGSRRPQAGRTDGPRPRLELIRSGEPTVAHRRWRP